MYAATSFSNSCFHKPNPQYSEIVKLAADPSSSISAVKDSDMTGSACNSKQSFFIGGQFDQFVEKKEYKPLKNQVNPIFEKRARWLTFPVQDGQLD